MFYLSIATLDNRKVINFANNSKDFVEVIFTIDGKEVKEGKDLVQDTKGYAYPPKLEKPVKKTKAGTPLQFNPCGGWTDEKDRVARLGPFFSFHLQK